MKDTIPPKWLKIKHQLRFFELGYDAGYYDTDITSCQEAMYRHGYESGWMDRHMELGYKQISGTHKELVERRKMIHNNDLTGHSRTLMLKQRRQSGRAKNTFLTSWKILALSRRLSAGLPQRQIR